MNLGFPEMLFLFLLALLLFGPKKLPEIGRQIGRGLAEFKRASNELKGQLENEMRLLEAEDREKKISPPPPSPPENTVAVSAETASAGPAALAAVTTPDPASAVIPASVLPISEHQQAAAAPASDPAPSPVPGVEGA
jgi:TatA/E family protein of Tat protein translocase